MQAEDADLINRLTAGEIYLNPIGYDVLCGIVPAFAGAPWTTIVSVNRSSSGKAAASVRTGRSGYSAVRSEGDVVPSGCSD